MEAFLISLLLAVKGYVAKHVTDGLKQLVPTLNAVPKPVMVAIAFGVALVVSLVGPGFGITLPHTFGGILRALLLGAVVWLVATGLFRADKRKEAVVVDERTELDPALVARRLHSEMLSVARSQAGETSMTASPMPSRSRRPSGGK